MRSARIAIWGAVFCTVGPAGFLACGGDDTNAIHASGDASTTDSGESDSTVAEAGSPGDATGDAGLPDAGACAPPADPSKAALCVKITPEAVHFLASDPHFDGKGILLVTVHSLPFPDGGDPSLAPAVVLPDLDGGADASLDLSQPVPEVRIDGLPPTTVYPQAVFVDDPSVGLKDPVPGWWLGGYDLTHGLQGAPLEGVSLTAGASATVTMDLRALRALLIRVSASVPPAGNGQGPLSVLVLDSNVVGDDAGTRAWGFGTAACANVLADGGATAIGFFIGSGPYFTLPVLDDFGLGDTFPAGAMTSLDRDAGLTVPAANEFDAGNAYVVTQTVQLNFVNAAPDGAVDDASCL